METADGFEVIKYIPCASLPYDKPGACYTVCALPEDPVSGKPCLIKGLIKCAFNV